MEEKKEKSKARKFLDVKFYAILGLIVMQVANTVLDRWDAGKEAQDVALLESRIKTMLTDANMWELILGSSYLTSEVSRVASEAKVQLKEEILEENGNKMSFEGELGLMTGFRNDSIMPKLAKIMIAVDKGEIMLKADADKYIREELRKLRRTVGHVDF